MIPDWAARIARTGLQMLAGGAFTKLFEQIATDVPAHYGPYILLGSVLAVTAAQNALEQAGVIPALLKPAAAKTESVQLPSG